uniref:Reverse transcriptase zinc-binding domain-containing protein n=1 Tax=Triticum urartu TaxID=4572 RepID=A0A8R7V853_TRIUA
MCILSNRHIKVNPQCPVCKSGPEDIRHLIFTCTRAKEVWGKLGLLEDINLALCVDRSGSVVLEELLTNPLKKSPVLGQLGLQEMIAVAAWYIWYERREAVKGTHIKSAVHTAFAI